MSETVSFTLRPNQQRLSFSEVPQYSQYVARALKAKFGEDEVQKEAYLQELQETCWTEEAIRERLEKIQTSEELESEARRLRRDILLSLIVRDITGVGGYEEVVKVITALAEVVVQKTVWVYSRELAKRFGVPMSADGIPQDLLVVGMGKLGGAELNVSSDIDLIFVYNEDGECSATPEFPNPRKQLSNREFFERLSKKIIPAIDNITYDGFVFRVDMRLRPNGDSGPIVDSCAMLEEYLMTQGRDWERFAWSKGRVVSTPVFASKEQFEQQVKELGDLVRPFVYRKFLDFSAISSLTDLHARIRAASRQREFEALKKGTNIKLGRGGIREIEFIVQTFQVIRAGRIKLLRERSTLKSLQLLAKEYVISQEEAQRLSEIYVFLRNFEHALQYVDDQQTQLYPDNLDEQVKIATMLGFSHEDLNETLRQANDYVAASFDSIFQTDKEEEHDEWPIGWETGKESTLDALTELLATYGYGRPGEAANRMLTLMKLRSMKLINSSARDRMVKLVKRIVHDIPQQIGTFRTSISADDLLERYVQFLEVIAGRPTYVSLLMQYPSTCVQVSRLLAASRWATNYLIRHPLLLDELLDERIDRIDDYTPVNYSNYIERMRWRLEGLDEQDQEARMNLVREFHHAALFKLLVADLDGRFTVERLADQLSALADATLEVVIEEAWKTVPNRHREDPCFAVIAFGKLGGKELGYASDLDLVFLYDDDYPDAEKVYGRLARRLLNWLTVTTTSGVLFDVDMRLRPNGESGMLVSTLDAFRRYERNEDGTGAWTWEHQALTRGRFCAGNRDIGDEFEKERKEILCRCRDPQRIAQEILTMRQRMHDGHVNKSSLYDIKHDSGGMVDVEFMVQYLVLTASHKHPELVNNFGNIKLITMASEAGLIDSEKALSVAKAYRDYRRLQHRYRLNIPDNMPVRVDPDSLGMNPEVVRSLWKDVFGPYEELPLVELK
ncbi:MAG: bifunctional [Burkholderiaceae bacterium]|nr:bifunctional [glutamate--ammonia ligase]-adenylyl-L-tyrosine phosphorylase/[glutamate--ammonia-ligase] adenylyltransferase [Burkholderiaceae bacterium]